MRNLIKKLLITVVVMAVVSSLWLWWDVNRYMDTPITVSEEKRYELSHGSNFIRAVNELHSASIISNKRYFRWYGRFTGLERKIKAGEYLIQSGVTPREILDMLTSGKVRQYAITIIEGWTFQQLLDVINKDPVLRHTLKDKTTEQILTAIGISGVHPEGQFLPDTYFFPKGLDDLAFLKRANKSLNKYLEQQWQNRAENLPYKNSYEALIMASIVEKETGLASERQAISGVFVRRLNKRMRLQTDPTVIYGMGKRYKGNIRKKDLLRDTPYNTYRRFGLPPTPIALAGKEAIYASLHPEDGNSLYFVARGDGSHHFSATLKEHNEAVIKYQLKGRKRSFSSYKNEKK